MSSFALLWGKILESSLWIQESKETRLVWITMLAMKDYNGVVQASIVGLADRAKVSLEECQEALRVLLSPDQHDTSKVEEGRRIREVPGGWQIINHDMYRFSTEAKRAMWRESKAAQRAAKNRRKKNGGPLPGERAAVSCMNRGDEVGANRITEDALPLKPSDAIRDGLNEQRNDL